MKQTYEYTTLSKDNYIHNFYYHCERGNLENVKKILENEFVQVTEMYEGFLYTCKNNRFETFKYIFEKNKKWIETFMCFLDNTFVRACNSGAFEIVKYLIKIYRSEIETEILYARLFDKICQSGYLNIVQYIANEYSYNVSETKHKELEIVCEAGYVDIFQFFVDRANDEIYRLMDNNVREKIYTKFKNLLFSACCGGNLIIVKCLIEKFGADPHHCKEEPFRTACCYGNLEIVKYLVEEHDLLNYVLNNEEINYITSDTCNWPKNIREYLLSKIIQGPNQIENKIKNDDAPKPKACIICQDTPLENECKVMITIPCCNSQVTNDNFLCMTCWNTHKSCPLCYKELPKLLETNNEKEEHPVESIAIDDVKGSEDDLKKKIPQKRRRGFFGLFKQCICGNSEKKEEEAIINDYY